MKKKVIIGVIILVAIVIGSIGAYYVLSGAGGSPEISEKKYQEVLKDVGVSGVESVVNESSLCSAHKVKMEKSEEGYYHTDMFIELCGEKDYCYYAAYFMGTDEAAAEEGRLAYIDYLLSQGFELVEDADFNDFLLYKKGNNVVMVGAVTGPVGWDGNEEGQYGIYVYFY